MPRLRIPSIYWVFFLVLVVECGVVALAYQSYREFDDKVYAMREGYLHEISHALKGPLAVLIQERKLAPDAIQAIFSPFEALTGEGLYEVGSNSHPVLELALWDKEGHRIYDSATFPNDSATVPEEVLRAISGETFRRDEFLGEGQRIMHLGSPIMADGRIIGILVVSKSNILLKPLVDHVEQWLAMISLGFIILVFILLLSAYLFLCRPIEIWLHRAALGLNREHAALQPLLRRQRFGRIGHLLDHLLESLSQKRHIERVVPYLAHELKNPLSTIALHAERLRVTSPERERLNLIEDILSQVRIMRDITRRILCVGALEKRVDLGEAEYVNVGEILDTVLYERQMVAESRTVRLTVDAPDDLEIRCDLILLKQAIGNLVQNSIQHSPRGAVVCIRVTQDDHQVCFSIRDHGPGIPKAALQHVFDCFYTHQHDGDGRERDGVGLFFVKEAADLHHGHVSLKNHPDGGVIAEFSIPR